MPDTAGYLAAIGDVNPPFFLDPFSILSAGYYRIPARFLSSQIIQMTSLCINKTDAIFQTKHHFSSSRFQLYIEDFVFIRNSDKQIFHKGKTKFFRSKNCIQLFFGSKSRWYTASEVLKIRLLRFPKNTQKIVHNLNETWNSSVDIIVKVAKMAKNDR